MDTSLLTAAEAFARRYHDDAPLCSAQADWTCSVRLEPNDAADAIDLDIVGGRVVAIRPAGPRCAAAGAALVVDAPRETLLDILESRLNPNVPYLFGTLTVRGREADFVRVDHIATMLCG